MIEYLLFLLYFSQATHITFICPMLFDSFPLDTQVCKFQVRRQNSETFNWQCLYTIGNVCIPLYTNICIPLYTNVCIPLAMFVYHWQCLYTLAMFVYHWQCLYTIGNVCIPLAMYTIGNVCIPFNWQCLYTMWGLFIFKIALGLHLA